MIFSSARLSLVIAAAIVSGCAAVGDAPNEAHIMGMEREQTTVKVKKSPPPEPLEVENLQVLMSGYLSALVADRVGDSDAAKDFYGEVLAQDPKHNYVRERAFALMLADGNIDRALELAENAPEDASNGIAMIHLARSLAHVRDGNIDQAEKMLNTAWESSPKMILIELFKAYMDLRNPEKKPEKIVHKLREFEATPMMVVFKYFHLGRIYERMGDLALAKAAYRNGYLVDPSSIHIVSRLGALHEHEGRTEEAQKLYDTFMETNPESVWLDGAMKDLTDGTPLKPYTETGTLQNDMAQVAFGFGTVMVGRRAFMTARQFLQLTLMLEPKHMLATFYLALLEEEENNTDKAIALYQKVEEGSVPYLAARVRIAEALYNKGFEDGAVARLEALVKKRPDVLPLHQALAELYFDMQNYQKAVESFDVVIGAIGEVSERHAGLFFARGAAHERLENYEKAADDMLQSLALDANNPTVLNYLGYMWADLDKNLEQAYDYIRKAVLLRPNDGAIVDSLGWAYYKQGKYERAVKYLEKATSLLPEDPVINAHLGDVYYKLNRPNEAATQWQRALELGLQSDSAEDAQRIEQKLKTLQDG